MKQVLLWVCCFLLIFSTCNGSAEPDEYILSFPTKDNYLNITVSYPYSNNYFVVIGDYGAPQNYAPFTDRQKKVANKLKTFVKSQSEAGKNLLFILTVGDNFYMAGQDCNGWDSQWRDIYGNLTDYYWFATMGNHDWGFEDSYSMCPWNNTKYTDTITDIPYAGNLLNSDKGGCSPKTFIMPDYSYYYTINELNFEFIVLEENSRLCPIEIFCERDNTYCMACDTYANCYNSELDDKNKTKGKQIGCNFLKKITTASETMMSLRAINSTNSNFVLSQHYPSVAKTVLNKFKNWRYNITNDTNIFKDDIIVSVYGHDHKQACQGTDTDFKGRSYCNLVLTGGGGGCCNEGDYKYQRSGFYAMGFDNDTNLIQLYDILSDQISFNNTGYTDIATNGNESALDGYTCESDTQTSTNTDNDSDTDQAPKKGFTNVVLLFVFCACIVVFT